MQMDRVAATNVFAKFFEFDALNGSLLKAGTNDDLASPMQTFWFVWRNRGGQPGTAGNQADFGAFVDTIISGAGGTVTVRFWRAWSAA